MDGNRTWHEQWPPLGYSARTPRACGPIAVEITLELEDWGKIVRLSRWRDEPHAHRRTRQRGVALITAVLIVALATILAVNVGFKGYLDQRRSGERVRARSGFRSRAGRGSLGRRLLRRDKSRAAKTDDFTEEWATPIPPIPIETAANSKASSKTCRAASISTAW